MWRQVILNVTCVLVRLAQVVKESRVEKHVGHNQPLSNQKASVNMVI